MRLASAREHSPLAAVLKDPPKAIENGARDIRVEDWFNDQIQTESDFTQLGSLLARVDQQKEQLDGQLRNAEEKLLQLRTASGIQISSLLEHSQTFERKRADAQERVMLVTESDSPEEAHRRLEGPMAKLQKLNLARSQVELLKEVEQLATDARQNLPGRPKEALLPYFHLRELCTKLAQLQEPAEGAAPHLVTHVKATTDRLWMDMKAIMFRDFEAILQKSNWPTNTSEPSREWSDCFERLLDLQNHEMLASKEALILLPMKVLCNTFVQKFQFHFFSNRPTNHPHKIKDHIFAWFIKTVSEWQHFLRTNVGPILGAYFRNSPLAGNSLFIDPVAAFITALLPILKERVEITLKELYDEPTHFSALISALMTFDDSIRNKFDYDGGTSEYGWKGLTWDILDTYFDRWLQVEEEFAFDRYKQIIMSENSGEIDYDSRTLGQTKTTYGAAKLADLVENMTQQYKRLRRFSHKIRFLISIQAEILHRYLGLIRDSLEVYQSYTTTIGRTLHGVTKEERAKLEGIGGLEAICKVYGSAEHVISRMNKWKNEEFFVDLWNELEDRARYTSSESKLAGPLTLNEVKDCTSEALASGDDGTVFDMMTSQYTRTQAHAESLLSQAIKYGLPAQFKDYLNMPQWTTIGEISSDLSGVGITPELDRPLRFMRETFNFLSKTLATGPLRRLSREAFTSLSDLLFNNVLLTQDFTGLGAARFYQDIIAIQKTVDVFTGTTLLMVKLMEGARVLTLPDQELKEACMQAKNEIMNTLDIKHLTTVEVEQILARRVEGRAFL